jgi:hypothetical protein
MGPIGSYTTTYTYTYDGPDKDKNEKIGVKMKLEYKAPDEKVGGGLPFKIKEAKLDGKDGTGEIIYDPKTGSLKSSTLTQKLDGKLTIEIGQQSTTVELSQTQTTKITTTDKNPLGGTGPASVECQPCPDGVSITGSECGRGHFFARRSCGGRWRR